jgi:hypothetical protein
VIRGWLRVPPEDRPALGRLVRDAWKAGPPPTSVDAMLAALRPALARVDRELEASSGGLLEKLRRIAQPPMLGGLATGAAAAALILFLLSPRPIAESGYVAVELTPTGDPTVVRSAAPDVDEPDARLAEGSEVEVESDDPVLIFENENSTLIWVVEGQDDISFVSWGGAG